MNLLVHVDLVKSEIDHHKFVLRTGQRGRVDRDKHLGLIGRLEHLLGDLRKAQELLEGDNGNEYSEHPESRSDSESQKGEAQTGSAPVKSSLLTSDLSDLPDEFLSELGLKERDLLESQILEVMEEAGKPLPVNDIMIALYRRSGMFKKRAQMTGKLYRMVQKRLIEGVPRKKGIYRLPSSDAQ